MLRGYELRCIQCGRRFEANPWTVVCSECGGLLDPVIRKKPLAISWSLFRTRKFGVWRYKELLPPVGKPVTMGEGGTPLVEIGRNLWVKFEGANPTGSFKDRGMTVAVSLAKEYGVRNVICASTGNTSASVAAYASRAGMRSFVVLPKGKVARGKLAQAILHGATIIEVDGPFDIALEAVMRVSGRETGLYPLNSFNPWRLEGQKTLAFEVADEIGVPDWVVLPIGNAGNISAIWKGFRELREFGLIDKLPRLAGVQAEGAAPVARAFKEEKDEPLFTERPETVATAIRIGKPVNWPKAFGALRESNGVVEIVSDREILEAQRALGRMGLGVEPASAASYAGYLKLLGREIGEDERVILVATGHALKDPDVFPLVEPVRVSGTEEAVRKIRELMA